MSDDKGGGLNVLDAQPDVSSDEASNAEPSVEDDAAKDAVQEVKKPKKKVEAQEAVKKEKDHLNIIFIGHVGTNICSLLAIVTFILYMRINRRISCCI